MTIEYPSTYQADTRVSLQEAEETIQDALSKFRSYGVPPVLFETEEDYWAADNGERPDLLPTEQQAEDIRAIAEFLHAVDPYQIDIREAEVLYEFIQYRAEKKQGAEDEEWATLGIPVDDTYDRAVSEWFV
jgi:hypothetical protein